MDKKTQQTYIELQMLEQQMQQVQKQLQLLEEQTMELNSTQEAIATLSKTKPGTEILVPINQGIFLKAAVKDTKELTVNVGAEVGVKKSVQQAGDLIKEQLSEIEKFKLELASNLEKLSAKAQELEKELSSLTK